MKGKLHCLSQSILQCLAKTKEKKNNKKNTPQKQEQKNPNKTTTTNLRSKTELDNFRLAA